MPAVPEPSWPLSDAYTLHPALRQIPPALPLSCTRNATPPPPPIAGLLHLLALWLGPRSSLHRGLPASTRVTCALSAEKTERDSENLKSDDTTVLLKTLKKLSVQLKNLTLGLRPCMTSLLPSDLPSYHSTHPVLTAGLLYLLPLFPHCPPITQLHGVLPLSFRVLLNCHLVREATPVHSSLKWHFLVTLCPP